VPDATTGKIVVRLRRFVQPVPADAARHGVAIRQAQRVRNRELGDTICRTDRK